MIPATQRPDGTWRKARKIRTGFNSRSGGATRYIPPAFREAAGGDSGGGGNDKSTDPADVRTRRLGEVVATDGRRNARRFVNAALFLLTTARVPSEATAVGPRNERHGEEASLSGGCESTSGTDRLAAALSSSLRSAARAAKAELGCDDCRRLPVEAGSDGGGAATSVSEEETENPSTPTEGSNEVLDGRRTTADKTGSKNRSGRPDQQQQRGSFDSHSSGWWAKLRQARRGRLAIDPEQQQEGATISASEENRESEAWVGFEFGLRASDVCCAEGQAAIVDFFKGRLGPQVAPQHADGETEDARSAPNGAKLEPRRISSPAETRPAGTSGNEGRERGETTSGGSGSGPECRGTETAARGRGREPAIDAGTAQERRGAKYRTPQTREEHDAMVLVAVLVFGQELSKRDRAELHGQAERTGGVASASHGMGEERFLTLTCGVGGRAGAVELELSSEKADLARRLFRLAQQEYHSRYECLSHREIREVVAQGGPNPEDHPDLFRLFDKQLNSSKTAGSKAKDSGAAAALPSPAGGSSAGQCGTTVAKVKNKKQQKGDNHPGGNAVGVVAEEEGGACPLQRGEEQEEQASSAGEVGETTERVQTVEKCPW